MADENMTNPGAGYLTMEQASKLIQEGIAAAMKPVTESLGAIQKHVADGGKSTDVTIARRDYINNKMKGIPQTYAERMPQTNDPVALAKAEQEIRETFGNDIRSYMKEHNIKIPNVGGDPGGGGTSSFMHNNPFKGGDDRTPSDLVSEGLRQSKLLPSYQSPPSASAPPSLRNP